MWEAGIDAVNGLFFNPLTGAAALALHLEHSIEADTPAEKMQELSKLKTDAVNIATLVAFSNFIKLPEVEGYEFIESVKKGIDTETARRIAKFSEMEEIYASDSLSEFDKQSMLEQILYGNDPEVAADEISLDDLLPPNDQVSLNGAGSPPAEAPPAGAIPLDEEDPFRNIPRAHDAYTLDEILDLDEVKSLEQAAKNQAAQQAGETSVARAGTSAGGADPLDEEDPFRNIPRARDAYTLDEILDLDEIKSLGHAAKNQAAQQAGETAVARAGTSAGESGSPILAKALAGESSAHALASSAPVALPSDRGFIPYREIPIITNMPAFELSLNQYLSEKLLNHPWDLYLGLNEEEGVAIPQYIRVARSVVRMYIKTAQGMYIKARRNLFNPALYGDIKKYFQQVLSTTDDNIIRAASNKFHLQIERIGNFLADIEAVDHENFVIISTHQKTITDPVFGDTYKYSSSITDNEYLKTLSKAFIAKGDPYRRVFIMYDAIPEFDINGVDGFGRKRNNMESTILHELSHLAADTKDFYPNEINPKSFELGNARFLLKSFRRHLASGTLVHSDDFRPFVEAFCQYYGVPVPNNEQEMLNLLRNNPVMQANMMIENADNFVAYVKDIGNMQPDLPPIVKKARRKGGKTKSNVSVGSKPGTSGINRIAKREIHQPEFDIAETRDGITFTTSREHYHADQAEKPAKHNASPIILKSVK